MTKSEAGGSPQEVATVIPVTPLPQKRTTAKVAGKSPAKSSVAEKGATKSPRVPRGKTRKGKARDSKPKVQWVFPREPLKTALDVAYTLKEKNGGNPWPAKEIASAMKRGAQSPSFFYQLSAAMKYGITTGGRDAEQIGLTPLGRLIAFAPDPKTEQDGKVKAFFSVEVFKKVFEYYNGGQLPEITYLGNTLQSQFGLDPATHEEFITVFRKNCEYLGLTGAAGATRQDVRVRTSDGSSGTITVGEPTQATTLTCFVVMPFVERSTEHPAGFFTEVLNKLIIPAATRAGLRVVTARRQGSDVIQASIVNDLLDADLVIADLTEHNANALFELGLRVREDKPIALIRAIGTKPVFDIDNMLRVLDYDPRLWISTVEEDLPRLEEHIRGAWDNRSKGPSFMQLLRTRPST